MNGSVLLLTPGPTPVPDEVSRALAEPLLHHRTPEFQALLEEVRLGLRELFQTEQEVLLFGTSGTGVMEAAVVNLFSPGDRVVVIDAGKFGSRWTELCQAFGVQAHVLRLERGKALERQQLESFLAHEGRGAKAVLFQASETSTGLKLPAQEITEAAHRAGAFSVCDSITALGAFDLPMDLWGVDVLMSSSQKALLLPPGLSFIALSERAWKAHSEARLPRYALDLSRQLKAQKKNLTAWTPPTQIIQGLRASLKLLLKDGLAARLQKTSELARFSRAEAEKLNLKLVSPQAPSEALTAVWIPSGLILDGSIPKQLREQHGIVIAGGQDELEGRILRISHFGGVTKDHLIRGYQALEAVLRKAGHSMEPSNL